jgi:hypothetical protein
MTRELIDNCSLVIQRTIKNEKNVDISFQAGFISELIEVINNSPTELITDNIILALIQICDSSSS